MSNLKYQSVEELRKLVEWCKTMRAGHEAAWLKKEAQMAQIATEVAEHRQLWHNIGQKEAAARMYLAKKELGE